MLIGAATPTSKPSNGSWYVLRSTVVPLSTLKDLVEATALASLKRFRLKRSWIKVAKKNSEIGVGGYGVVHRAVLQKSLLVPNVPVAVKKFHTSGDWEKRLRVALALVRELEVWAKLDHPNVLPLVGFHLSSGLDEAWLVSPYASNGNVFEYLERTNLGLDDRLELAKDTAKGLQYLHTRTPPICHGDIKALNVLINASKRAMLCDLGLAGPTGAEEVGGGSNANDNGGTVRYWSPELFENNCPTLKADVWAWGCLLLEIVTGQAPYHQILLEGRLIHEISNNKTLPADLDELECPPHIRDLLARCWEIDPERRPTMTESLALLRAGNLQFYRSDTITTSASAVSSTHHEGMERELADLLVPLASYQVNTVWFEFPVSGSTVGAGGFGIVHKAVMKTSWRQPGVVVAVKKLKAMGGMDKRLRMATALVRELAVWARLSHPNIIPLIGYYLSPQRDEAWLVSTYMAPGNLRQYLLSGQPSSEMRLRLNYLGQLNILINTERRAVLCDFGLAKTMENLPSGLTTSTFNQAGSLAYESPELLLGKSLRALESDVWAWGCLLQEIFSGKCPYHWANNAGAIVKWITQDIPPATLADIDCTTNVRRLLVCCWQSRPEVRPSMGQCIAVLGDGLSGIPGREGSESAISVLQALEAKLGIFTVEDIEVERSNISFTEALRIGTGQLGALYEARLSVDASMPGDVVALRRVLPFREAMQISD
ncbi:hypothetical protein FRB99_008629, partial [Tulasnella sp. 403]